MGRIDMCAWKLIDPREFVLGQSADRCGAQAAIKILRPHRKADLFLCECHFNAFIQKWGLFNQVEFL